MIQALNDALVNVLQFFYAYAGHNYGVAIILLTLAVKIVFHPLTRKQLRAMKQMQALAPQIAVLRGKYKEDPKALNVEMMNLYRTAGVNPLGGCLPMLVQLPILFTLFAVFRRTDIFKGALFLGLPLEKALPFSLQAILQNPLILLLPILVGVTTYVQQRMSITDPQQARFLAIMPVFFAWFSVSYPVGLSIYWIVQSLAGIVEYRLVVGLPRPIPAAAPPGGTRPAGVLTQRPKGTKKK